MERDKKVIQALLDKGCKKKKGFALLIDPDKAEQAYLETCALLANRAKPELILIGGSLVFNSLESVFERMRDLTDIPLVLFPGSSIQLCQNADAILFLSLISGRNSEFLIGNHVVAAPFIVKHGIEAIPTGYLLIDGGMPTAVEYISQTKPIPANKPELAIATALAGQLLGHKVIYMDAGSGAANPISPEMIHSVSNSIKLPLIVGGGIRSAEQALSAYRAGADIVVVGNKVEENPGFLDEISEVTTLANSEMQT
jgi:phosphoglycerol geranylgeranyltransferase